MKEIKRVDVALVEDRNTLKWRVNLMFDGRYLGFIRPV